ncbi:hypothetical protein BpHYR1_007041 [Brachionus plicatilis]|uniref:G-protein coupled receptors family 1 profile domain-containing protein n=1 Tax=Brachionus plicatilis TaxID=10195 RepID=A0A3M7SKS3_BRAPC|nr:hypothetical protein BpHYR1_007041 [Brachionus plicatilis]
MNISSTPSELKIYGSLDELSEETIDLVNIYVLPSVCLLGIILNFLSIIILVRLRFKTELYKFMLSISVSDFLFLLMSIFLVVFRCGRFCPYGYTYISKLYELYFYLYLGNVLLMFVLLVNLLICYNRIRSFSSRSLRAEATTFRVKILLVILVTTLANIPNYAMTRYVKKIGIIRPGANGTSKRWQHEMDVYSVEPLDFSLIEWVKVVLFVINLARGFILMIILFLLNLIIAIKLRHYIKARIIKFGVSIEKSSLSNNSTQNNSNSSNSVSEYKFTVMTLIFGSFYLIGNLPNSLAPILFIFISNDAYMIYLLFGNFVLFSFHSSNFVFFYLFNNDFKTGFHYLLAKIMRRS